MPATKSELAEPVQHGSLAAALAMVQSAIPSVAKDNTAQVQSTKGSYSYKYADLAVITPLILPLLGRNGLAFTAQPTMVGDVFALRYVLTHESGESIEGVYPLPDPTSARPQEIGSAITYARRYALCAVTGVAPGGDDDDAAAANERPAASRKPRQQQRPAPVQVASRDWSAEILDVEDVDGLRKVHQAAEAAGELGLRFSPEHVVHLSAVVEFFGLEAPPESVTVGQVIGAVKKAIESRPVPTEQPAGEDVPAALQDWDVRAIPADEEPES